MSRKARSKKYQRPRSVTLRPNPCSSVRPPFPTVEDEWAFHFDVETCNVCDVAGEKVHSDLLPDRRQFELKGNEKLVWARAAGYCTRWCPRCEKATRHTIWRTEGSRVWWHDSEKPNLAPKDEGDEGS